ncbi:Eukaryotic translation initiation factor 4G [Vitis vinifera]|uniref:Eukaryotic translation initiation factor 4G n=1 Tax=Vitis vinifera TaxID=29760 RepID=A0A438IEY1_VITVI|nr:Eukaryotic translation initiation factor 4G [Vitis vinifera]
MSINQSRSDKNDGHYRKSGARSGSSAQQRTFLVGAGKGGGNAPPSSAFVPSSSLSSNRSFKRPNNAQGGQSRVSVGAANSESANPSSQQRGIQNGVHTQPSSHGSIGVSDAPAGKPTDSAPQRISRAPKAPSSKVPSSYTAAVSSDTASQTAPDNAPDDSRLQFSLQFGSINPGFVNGMQIPARTSSAPPNLDEQKRDQLCLHCRFLPILSSTCQGKGVIASEQSNAGEAHPLSKGKRDVQVSSASPANQTQKPSVLPMTGISMQIPYHQPQVSVQFSGPNPQLQSQGMTATSLQMPMPMPLQMGNASQVQQQVFVPGLQPHPLQPQGMIHQGQGLSFTTPMGPQLSPQLGNLQMGMTPQYTQQQPGKFGGPRKTTVKITHPDTHEELRLDKRADPYLDGGSSGPSGPRSHPNLPPPSQSIPSFTPPHPINFYTNSYNASSLFFPSPSSLPLTSTPLTSSTQTPRFNYPVSQGPPTGPFINAPTHNSLSVSKTGTAMQGVAEPLNLEHARDVHNVMSSVPSSTSQVTIKPAVVSVVEKVTDALPPLSSAATEKVESPKLLRLPGETSSFHLPRNTDINSETSLQQPKTDLEPSTSTLLPGASKQFSVATDTVSVESSASNTLSSAPSVLSDENASVVTSNEGRRRETLGRSNSIKEHQKKTGKKGHPQPQQQVGGQTASLSNLPSRPMERGISSKIGVTETLEPKAVHGTLGNSEDVLDFTREPVSTITADSADASELKADSFGEEGQGESELPEGFKQDAHCLEKSSESISSISLEAVKQPVPDSELKVTTSSIEVGLVETAQEVDVSVSCCTEIDRTTENSVAPTPTTLESINVETVPSNAVLPTSSYGDKNSSFDASLSRSDSIGVKEIIVAKSAASDQESVPVPTPYLSESTVKPEGAGVENGSGGLVSHPVSSSKDKPTVELNRPKTTVKKKKRKEILQKADAAGTTSDLYMAYKGPEEKKETIISSESTSAGNVKQVSADAGQEDVVGSDIGEQPKAEPDDWEDAADISTPKLETQDNGVANGGSMLDDKDGNGVLGKKYSRDFLLTFADQCNDLPEGFEITSDIAEALMISNINMSHLIDRDSYPSPGRIVDRQAGGSRPDRRGVAFDLSKEKLWCVKEPTWAVDYAMAACYWLPEGLIPSPQTSVQMHRAEKKYEVGKATDEEEVKQRKLKAILNKLTPQNFEKLFEQVKAVNIDNADTLTRVISQIFDKALMEPTFCEMYANFCFHLARELPDFSEDNEKITFKRLLLNKCQENLREGKENKKKLIELMRRVRLNSLKRKGRRENQSTKKDYQNPDEEDIESLCKLMSTIGEMIDHPKAKEHMDVYFDRMAKLSNNMKLSSRVRFMLKDAIDLRKINGNKEEKLKGRRRLRKCTGMQLKKDRLKLVGYLVVQA